MNLDKLPPKAILFLTEAYGLPSELGVNAFAIPFRNYIMATGEEPTPENFIACGVSSTFNGNKSALANFVASAFQIPEAVLMKIFLETNSMEERDSTILNGTYTLYCNYMDFDKSDDESMDCFLTQAFLQTFLDADTLEFVRL